MTIVNTLITIAFSYLLGTFQTAYLYGKVFKKIDIRDYGSGNSGTTNAIRVFGKKVGALCLFCDMFKGIAAVLLTKAVFGNTPEFVPLQLIAGIACIFGHNYPFYMGFKGGKGVAASIGIILAVNWQVWLVAAIPAIILLLTTRIMSLASLTFELLSLFAFIGFYITDENLIPIAIASALYPLISFWRHKENIIRLINGEEPRVWGEGSRKIKIEYDNETKDNPEDE